jgi:hypothetical protein
MGSSLSKRLWFVATALIAVVPDQVQELPVVARNSRIPNSSSDGAAIGSRKAPDKVCREVPAKVPLTV